MKLINVNGILKRLGFDISSKQAASTVSTPGVDSKPAYFSPSFFYHNGKYTSIVELYCRPGTNRQMRFDDVIDIIPIGKPGVDLVMLVNDCILADSLKRQLTRDNARNSKTAIENIVKDGDKTENDARNTYIHRTQIEDYDDYEMIIDAAEPIVGFKIQLLVIGDTRASVDEQISELNIALAQRHEGFSWDSLAGDQYDRVSELMRGFTSSEANFTSTGSNYAGINFAVSPGLSDPEGIPVGTDALSLAGSTSTMDFDASLKRVAAIAAAASSVMPRYETDELPQPVPAASILAQAVANHACIRGHRAHHIVLNEFDYFQPNLFYRPIETVDLFARYDAAKMTLNPLQGFGDINDVVSVFDRLTNKIVNIFDILENLTLSQEDKGIILTVIERFYFNQRLWITDAAIYPKRTRIVDIDRPETYPTMTAMINEFTTLGRAAAADNRELKADRIDTLYHILNHALTANIDMLGRPTSIPNSHALQTFYEFKNIASLQMKQVQLLNMIEYVIWTADPGDVLVIHGCDNIYRKVFDHIAASMHAAERKQVRVLLAFDTIDPPSIPVDDMSGLFNLKGSLYNDLDTDLDFTIVGRCLPAEVDMFENALNMQLSDTVRLQLAAKMPHQYLIHRAKGAVNNFIYANVVI